MECEGKKGVRFTVWAPHAREVRVVGDFNGWNGTDYLMDKLNETGIWSLFVPDLTQGERYKYEILTPHGTLMLKSDPYAFYSEVKPLTASRVYDLEGYEWSDRAWQNGKKRKKSRPTTRP